MNHAEWFAEPEACALIDAYHFAEAAREIGLHPTRTADRREIRVEREASSTTGLGR